MRAGGMIMVMGALAGCAAQPVSRPPQAGAAAVTVDGQGFAAEIAPGAPGQRLSAAGARPVAGLTVTVSRPAHPLHYSDGALAKKAARAACDAQGGRFEPAAIGRVSGPGLWSFPGACA